MNKEEKIGMYTRDEIFEHLCENSDIGMLGRSMYDAVMSKIDNLQSQLATYKEKEDRLRKILGNYRHYSYPTAEQQYENEGIVNSAYKILNDKEISNERRERIHKV